MKILFTPNDLGGGFGHVSRCLALADYARSVGEECAFLLHNSRIIERVSKESKVYTVNLHSPIQNFVSLMYNSMNRHQQPLYVVIPDVSYQVIRDGFTSVNTIRGILDKYLKIITAYKPDVIVNDTNLLIGIAAKISDVPLVQITRKAFHPDGAKIIWCENRDELIFPDAVTLFNQTLEILNLDPIQKIQELLQGDLYIVPSIPELEPGLEGDNVRYVGPLIRKRDNDNGVQIEADGRRIIYITIGAGAVGHQVFFNLVNRFLGNKEYRVIISSAGKFKNKYKDLPQNIEYHRWVPGKEVINQSDLVIFHGGYGTMMETLEAAVPSIVVPFHSEQESNGRRLAENGCSLLCKLSTQESQIVSRTWAYGNYTYAVQNRFTLSGKEFLAKIETVLGNESFKKNADHLKTRIKSYAPENTVLQLLKKRLGVT